MVFCDEVSATLFQLNQDAAAVEKYPLCFQAVELLFFHPIP
jgi:hypothetical protein